jgi:hypothetical protein
VIAEPATELDLAYKGRLRGVPPSATLAEFHHRRVDILLDSIERMACDAPPPEGAWYARADTIREQLGKARHELQELRAGR